MHLKKKRKKDSPAPPTPTKADLPKSSRADRDAARARRIGTLQAVRRRAVDAEELPVDAIIEGDALGESSVQPLEADALGKRAVQPLDADATGKRTVQPIEGDALGERTVQPLEGGTHGERTVQPLEGDTPAAKPTRREKRRQKKRNRKKRHGLRNTLLVLVSLLIVAAVGAFEFFGVADWQKLDVSKITAAARTGAMYDGDGVLIIKIQGAQNRVPVALDSLPAHVRNAFLAAEDLRFYQHHGVDVVRIFGAVAENIKQGSFAQGASTITQQLIRQSHLSTQKTIARKLEEAWLALQLERAYSKDQILEMYLNYIYFGSGAYGIQAAAQTYFEVDAADLSLAQAASLAATIKAPGYYAPATDANANRRAYVLATMLAEGMIAQPQHDAALAETIAVAEAEPIDTPYGWFADAVLDEAEAVLGLTSDQVLTGGYYIDTTLNRAYQDTLLAQFERDVFPANASDGTQVQGAAACVNTKTGAVLAIVGGRSYDVRRGLNRATQLRRQPGSALKPIVAYAPAIDRYGYTTASVLKDEPTSFNGYKPRNSGYTYYGNVTFRSALKSSLNVSAVSLLNQIGVQSGKAYLTSVGIPLDPLDDNLALALGAMTYGVSPVQLAAAYAPFGNGGTFSSPHFITRILDSTGKTVYAFASQRTRVLKAQSAYLMTSLLSTVTSSGTGAKLSGAGTPVAGKTGTVNMTGGNRDIWMAAYNSEISCAFWMGFDQPDSRHKLASWVSGGDNTALMAKNYFYQLYRNRDKPQFAKPDGIISLEIDKKSIEWRGEAMLAVDLTPKAYRYTEVFSADNHPTKRSDVWTPPRTPSAFRVSHSDSGQPVLVIQPADTAVYRVQRDAVGESFVLAELYGTAGETLYYTDNKAQPGVVYTYRVIPVHAELLDNGIVLEGVQAVQVAQVKARGGVVDRVLDALFGRDGAADSGGAQTENTSSMFWGLK